MIDFFSGWVLGFLGSFHCIAMCGPIALSLPVGKNSRTKFFLGRIFYNFGRIVTYSVLGIIVGYIGVAIFFAGFQQIFSIIIGTLIIFTAFLPSITSRITSKISLLTKIHQTLRKFFSFLFQKQTLLSLFGIGIINGFLPCGFVYMALANAATFGNEIQGMIFLSGFGFGTLPMMFGVSLIGNVIKEEWRKKIFSLIPIGMVILGILFIVRGMGLGIPYISPNTIEKKSSHQEILCE